MRIRRLLLRNYRRYRETEAEFPEGVFALLGRNGSGKSTAVEAISFALFGPAAIRTAKELLRSDAAAPADAVHVELDLDLGGQAIRIVRELRGKALTPSASLEVDGVVLVPPGAGSSEAATREIERRLGMDRDAFHTTVVAQQGELSRLADAKPADRKRLLMRMLGIDRVDGAIDEARSRRNVAALTLERLRALLPDLPALEAEGKAAAAAAQGHRAQVTALQMAVAQSAAASNKARLDAEAVEKAAQAAREQAFQLASARAEEGHRGQTVARLQPEVAQAEAAAIRADELAPLAGTVEQREEEVRAATLVEAARGQHAERLRYIARQRLVVQRTQAEVTALAQPAEAVSVAVAVTVGPEGLAQAESSLQLRSNELAVLDARWAEMEQRRRRLEQLGPDAPCPTCERPLNGQFSHLHRHAEESAQGILLQRRDAAEAVLHLKGEVQTVRTALEATTRQVAEAQRLAARREELVRRHTEEAQRLAEMEGTLGPEPPPPADLKRLRDLALEARRAREEQLRLQGLAARRPTLAIHLAEASRQLEGARAAREAIEKSMVPFDAAILPRAQLIRDQAILAHLDAERRLHGAKMLLQQAESDQANATRRLEEGRIAVQQVRGLEGELQLWNALVGRSGGGMLDRFRDHLVGRVGPAISAEASRLLARFTGGRYSEILLDDDYQVFVTDHGVPYALERFSGGEADVVHLALRLAVSRLLAERGGVELRFLALDEVFGSLDRERREHVVGALQELGTLYSQVLVVSHLEGLQEALGQVLRVEEGQAGEATLVAD